MSETIVNEKIKVIHKLGKVEIHRLKPTERTLIVPELIIDWCIEHVQDLVNKPFNDFNRVELETPDASWTFFKSKYYGNLMVGFQTFNLQSME